MILLVVHGKLLKSAGGLELDDDVIGITGHQTQQIEEFNRQRVQLGLPQLDPSFKEEVEQAIKDEEANQKKKDEESVSLLELFKKESQECTVDGPPPHDIPLPL
jgi:transcription initiation factor TFIID subunit 5